MEENTDISQALAPTREQNMKSIVRLRQARRDLLGGIITLKQHAAILKEEETTYKQLNRELRIIKAKLAA